MSAGERRLDVYKLVAVALCLPLGTIAFATELTVLFVAVPLLVALTHLGTEIVRARRYGHPMLNRWIPRKR
jgi:hypothetical protein